jgi:hypothetical protein
MADLAVIVPTRGRPANVAKVISAWDFTNAWDHADLILAVDADDPECQGYADLFEQNRNPDTGDPLFSIMVEDRWIPMVEKLNRAALRVALGRRYFAVGFAGDDHLPRTIGWARRYLDVLHELGTGMVYGDDGYQGANLATEWAITSDVVRALGRMVPAGVDHLYCDNSILEMFRAVDAVRHLPEVRIEHMHPAARKAFTDEQYQRVNSRDQYRRDRATYLAWQRNELPSQAQILRSLRSLRSPGPAPAVPVRDTIPRAKEGKTVTFTVPRRLLKMVGATPNEIGLTLADLGAQVPAGQAIVELGVYRAKTTLLLSWGARHGNGAHVYGIDPWDLEGNTYGEPFTTSGTRNWARYNVKAQGFANFVTLIQSFSADAAGTWSGPPIGLLFVDGDHSYEGARGDITGWARHLADGAVIAVDDYGHPDWPGVKEAVDALVAENFLAPVEIFHDRLAVTTLGPGPAAITSEGVNLPPVKVPEEASVSTFGTPVELVHLPTDDPDPVATQPAPEEGREESALTQPGPAPRQPERAVVQAGELDDVVAGTSIEDLNTVQLRALAKAREITLGARKDKRAEMLDALRAGE